MFPGEIVQTLIASSAEGGPAPAPRGGRSLAEALGLEGLVGGGWMLQLCSALIALVLALVVYQLLRRSIALAARRNRGVAEFEYIFVRLLRWSYLPLAALFVLQQAGVQVGNLWTVLTAAIAMVAIGLVATWSMLSNVCATFMHFATRLFRIDDEIEILEATAQEGLRGRVVDINLVYTVLEQGEALSKIPNNIFLQKAVRVHRGSKGGTVEELEGAAPDAGSEQAPQRS